MKITICSCNAPYQIPQELLNITVTTTRKQYKYSKSHSPKDQQRHWIDPPIMSLCSTILSVTKKSTPKIDTDETSIFFPETSDLTGDTKCDDSDIKVIDPRKFDVWNDIPDIQLKEVNGVPGWECKLCKASYAHQNATKTRTHYSCNGKGITHCPKISIKERDRLREVKNFKQGKKDNKKGPPKP